MAIVSADDHGHRRFVRDGGPADSDGRVVYQRRSFDDDCSGLLHPRGLVPTDKPLCSVGNGGKDRLFRRRTRRILQSFKLARPLGSGIRPRDRHHACQRQYGNAVGVSLRAVCQSLRLQSRIRIRCGRGYVVICTASQIPHTVCVYAPARGTHSHPCPIYRKRVYRPAAGT